jgi:DNA-binding CsgD family transcriptional regulator
VRVALVGYTNVGKSTIMNLLSKSDVFAENKLFATVDSTVRKVVWQQIPFLLTDTVGFIRKQSVTAPTELLAAIEKVLADRAFEVRQDHNQSSLSTNLPTRAQEVLRLLANSCSNQEIARRTNMSLKTVEKWIDRIYQDLGIENTSAINARVAAATRYFAETQESDKS